MERTNIKNSNHDLTSNSNLVKLSIVVESEIDGLAKHASAWNRLAKSSLENMPMCSHAWIAARLENKQPFVKTWYVHFAYNGDKLVGVLPIVESVKKRLFFESKILQTPYSFADLLMEKGYETEILNEFIRSLNKVCRNWYAIRFKHIPETSYNLKSEVSKKTGIKYIAQFAGFASTIAIKGTFSNYFSSLPKNFRQNIRRRSKQLENLKDYSFIIVKEKELMTEYLNRFMAIESSGWKGESGTSLSQSESKMTLFRTLMGYLSKIGWLEFHFLCVENTDIASQIIVCNGKLAVRIKIAYNENYSRYSPGNVLTAKMLECIFNEGQVQEVNLLTNQPWHSDWNVDKRSYYNVDLIRQSFTSVLFKYLPKKLFLKIKNNSIIRSSVKAIKGHKGN